MVLFGTSLIACTFRRQLPALKAAKIWKYYRQPREFNKLTLSAELSVNGLTEIKDSLTKKGYKINQDNNSLYAQKGIIGRVGPIIVHVGMIFILLGAIWGAFTGFFAQEMIAEGQTFTIKKFYRSRGIN